MMQPTEEQRAIVGAGGRHPSGKGRRIVVNAYAGTGKTKTLEMRAQSHREKTLMLYFGAQNAAEARARMPQHVKCMTGHGLARAANRGALEHKFKPSLQWFEVASLADVPHVFARPGSAAHVLATVQRFMWSADLELVASHIPRPVDRRQRAVALPLRDDFTLEAAQILWDRMIDPRDTAVPATHDTLLKLFQLSKPRLLAYRTVMLDEGQDSNECILDVILRQEHATVLVVGDNAQAVFEWRGAVNALSRVAADEYLRLSQSWRFGPVIADVANAVLIAMGECVPLRGVPGMAGSVGPIAAGTREMVLGRSTSGVVAAAVEAAASNKRIGFIGGVRSYPLESALSAWRLWRGERPGKGSMLAGFSDWSEFKTAMDEARDRQGQMLIRMVDEYGRSLPSLVERVSRLAVEDLCQAEIIVSTAHRAKGLEFDAVRMLDDYPDPLDEDGELLGTFDPQERNLLYVAATRARRHLDPSPCVRGLMTWAQSCHA